MDYLDEEEVEVMALIELYQNVNENISALDLKSQGRTILECKCFRVAIAEWEAFNRTILECKYIESIILHTYLLSLIELYQNVNAAHYYIFKDGQLPLIELYQNVNFSRKGNYFQFAMGFNRTILECK